jgi:hypothetical protein
MNALDAALNYAHRGWHVFPNWPGNKSPCVGADRDHAGRKIAKTGGLYKATTDAALISTWWKRWPSAMIGVRTGAASGVWAIDPDAAKEPGKPDGAAAWRGLVREHGAVHTHTHLTPGGGKHLLFKWDHRRPVSNSEGLLKDTGINVRGEGGYVIAPPSRRADGKTYDVDEPLDFFSFAEAPEWLYAMLKPKTAEKTTSRIATILPHGDPTGRIQGILNTVAAAGEGTRNKLLYWGAMRVVDMVAKRAVPPSEGDRAFGALFDAALHAGLPDREIIRTLQSARASA